MNSQWATVTSSSPVRVRIDGAASDGPALAPVGMTLTAQSRVRVELAGSTLLITQRYT